FFPQLSWIWISYSPSNLTPELEPLGIRNSTWASIGPNFCLVRKSWALPFLPLRMTPLPGLATSLLAFVESSSASPQISHSSARASQASSSLAPIRSIQPSPARATPLDGIRAMRKKKEIMRMRDSSLLFRVRYTLSEHETASKRAEQGASRYKV